jgi:hypothetical protein
VFGIADFARVFYFAIEISGSARAGVREAIINEPTDVGDAIRSEPNSAIANSAAAWGNTGPGGANADCTSAVASQQCGDPNGCPASVFTGTRLACFAVRACTLTGGDQGTCSSYGAWVSRPTSTSSAVKAIEIIVVYRFTPVTPIAAQLLPTTNGFFRLTESAIGDELYF